MSTPHQEGEELAVHGTFTPAITFGGLAVGITYTRQVGNYTKVGNRVFFNLYIYLSSKGTSVGSVSVTSLPFTSKNITGYYNAVNVHGDLLAAAATTAIQGYVVPNATTITLTRFTAGAATTLADTDFGNGSELMISGHYPV